MKCVVVDSCSNHPAVHQNLPWVMKIIAEVLRREIFEASEDTLRRLVAIARQIQVRRLFLVTFKTGTRQCSRYRI